MKKFQCLLLFAVCFSGVVRAQVTVRGSVVDAETREPVIGAIVVGTVSGQGTAAGLDGTFTLGIPNYDEELDISSAGYLKTTIPASASPVEVLLRSDIVQIGDVVVTASVGIQRRTPVAMSVLTPEIIETRLSNQEFPELLKATPSVYVTKDGGGFGDAQLRLRGFESANVAVMINGVPMNDMEWGGLYWSNWAGLSDVTRSTQVQRGLGASKVSAPSVGGSYNILTRSTDAERGGTAYTGYSNEGYSLSFSVSTGLSDNGWAVTILGAKRTGNRYIQGTEYNAYTYFLNVSKIINARHRLSFTAFGTPQTHFQRSYYDRMLITEWQKLKDGYRYNPTYGFNSSGRRTSANYNHYHKPQISLNHYWEIDGRSSLSTAVYLSLGFGGGYAWRGTSYNDLYGVNSSTGLLNTGYRTDSGYFDYAKLEAENAAATNGSRAVITDSRNNHIWTGLLSTYNMKFNNSFELSAGVDFRYYEGLHDAYIVDLMGGNYFVDPSRANVTEANRPGSGAASFRNAKLREGDIVYRDNTGYVVQGGLFAQLEYTWRDLNAFVSGSGSNNTYWKVDRFYYDNAKSAVGNFLGFTAKGGANYNINSKNNVFFNIGYVSRAPFMNGGYFVNIHNSNEVNANAVNEKLFSVELGYGFRSRDFTLNLNLYRTTWMDKTSVTSISGNVGYVNLTGIDALHQGVELEFTYRPFRALTLRGMFSMGDWHWLNDATGYAYNNDGQAIDRLGNPVEILSPEHASATLNLDGVKVGNSAQTTAALGFSVRFLKNFNLGVDANYFGNNYAAFTISPNVGSTINHHTPWKIPDYVTVDLNMQYHFDISGVRATLFGNVNNLLNQEYIADATDLNAATTTPSTWRNVAVFYGFGITYSMGLKIYF